MRLIFEESMMQPVTTPTISVESSTIASLNGVSLNGSCKLADNQIVGSSNQVITFPTSTSTLATTAQTVQLTGAQTVAGVKTFSSAPKLSTNTLTTSSGYTVTIPNATATLANLSSSQTLSNKTLASTTKLASGNTIKTYSGGVITFPSSTATLATSSDISALNTRLDGMNPALVFDTQAAMNSWLSNSANKATLVVGQNLYIRALDVPDYWWDGSKACELETAKIDLTNYALNQTVLDEYSTLQTQLLYFETRVQCLIAYLERTQKMTDLESIIDEATEATFNS